MTNTTRNNLFNVHLILITLLTYAICYILLTHAFMFWEVSWHIEGAKRILEGGTYLTNLFDDNSPPVFAFYIPFVWLSKIITVSQYKLAFLYILIVFAISNYFTLQVLKNRLTNTYSIYLLYSTAIIVTLFFGITILGERENIIVCLSLPYLFMNLLNKYENDLSHAFSLTLQTIIAFLATVAFLQVPYYLLLPLSIDIIDYVANRQKPQIYQTLFYLFFITGFILSYLLYPAYYNFLLKLLYHFQIGFDNTYTSLISNDFFKYIIYTMILTTFFTLYFYRRLIYFKLIILVLATLLIYMLEKKIWFYHFYPIICYTFLSFIFIHIDNKFLVHKKIERLLKHFLMICYALPLLVIIASIYTNYYGHFLRYHNKNTTINKLIAFSKSTNPNNNKTLFFSTRVYPAYLLTLYGNLDVISPWANNWMLPTLINFKNQPRKIKQYYVAEKWLFRLTLSALRQQHPTYIIYYQSGYMPYIKQKNFDVLQYLKQNKMIANELKYYQFDQQIDQYRILKRRKKT